MAGEERGVTPISAPASFAIVPAAGRSVRMGSPKLLLPWGEQTVIEAVLAAWQASRVSHVVMTVQPEDVKLATTAAAAGAEIVTVDPPPVDMKASVLAGLNYVEAKYCPAPNDAWLLAPADMPMLTPQSIDLLLTVWNENVSRNAEEILALSRAGRRGHPVLFPWSFAAAARKLRPDEGLNRLLDEFGCRELPVNDQGSFVDLDTPEDYRRWNRAIEGNS
jgi:molybdenum cofactor cytidylyltransferase